MSSGQFVAAIDFDYTLHNPEDRLSGYRMGRPYPGAKEAMIRLKDLGAKIIIFTCRARSPHGEIDPDYEEYVSTVDHVGQWLDYFGIPFDSITAMKPLADVYVDDRAVPFTGDWAHTEREILAHFHMGGSR